MNYCLNLSGSWVIGIFRPFNFRLYGGEMECRWRKCGETKSRHVNNFVDLSPISIQRAQLFLYYLFTKFAVDNNISIHRSHFYFSIHFSYNNLLLPKSLLKSIKRGTWTSIVKRQVQLERTKIRSWKLKKFHFSKIAFR